MKNQIQTSLKTDKTEFFEKFLIPYLFPIFTNPILIPISMAKATKKETPLMTQYNTIKAKYPDALLLFRVGDFYETLVRMP
ncbi:hypothetical protein [Chryseobacterium sp.]|uniref:hypothetical protein n=1 Tax=Chryseobacterium sp. TaxID=1871047 RepID=UPI002FC9A14D